MTSRSLTFGQTSYPLVLPKLRDPRLHVAAVVLTVHALGQIGLHFRLSIPQILAAMLTCAVIEVALTFRQTRTFVWPASAMLTGSGVALVLRVVGTPADQPWFTDYWWVFSIVAGLALLSKYVIRFEGTHIFNPSNLGLVVAFVVLGSSRVEPLDFWWGPLDPWLLAAYVVIIGGGSLIDRRLRLLGLAVTFWVTFAITLGILAASGHCFTANWAFAPVCGQDFWRVVVLSPELMIFLFFMITDPKTAPSGQVARVVFGVLVAAASTILMATQTDEFGAKVGLLAGLVVMCAARPVLERVFPAPRSEADDLGRFMTRWFSGRSPGGVESGVGGPLGAPGPAGGGAAPVRPTGPEAGAGELLLGAGPEAGVDELLPGAGPEAADRRRRRVRAALRVGLVGLAAVVVVVSIVAAGTPARSPVLPDVAEALARMPARIDPATLPPVTVEQDVVDWNHEIAGPGMQQIVMTLAQNLDVESQALLTRDATLLKAVDHGDRLAEMQRRLQQAEATGRTVIDRYRFDSLDVSLLVPFGVQTGLSLGFHGRGMLTEETYDAGGRLLSSTTSPFDRTFAMRRATGDRWLNVAVLPEATGG